MVSMTKVGATRQLALFSSRHGITTSHHSGASEACDTFSRFNLHARNQAEYNYKIDTKPPAAQTVSLSTVGRGYG